MPSNSKFSVSDTGGDTPKISSDPDRDIVMLRVASGGNTVYLGVNDTAVSPDGFYMEAGDAVTISGKIAKAAIFAVCASGESATVNYDLFG